MEYEKKVTEAPGKSLLRVSSILMIIFSGIVLVLGIIGIIAAGAIGGIVIAAASTIVVTLAILPTVVMFIAGIFGIAFAGRPERAGVCLVFGIIVVVLTLLSIFSSSFAWTQLAGLILPVLYLIGAIQNKKAA